MLQEDRACGEGPGPRIETSGINVRNSPKIGKKKAPFLLFVALSAGRVGPVSVFGTKTAAWRSLQTGRFAARNPKLFSLLAFANRTLAHFKSFWVAKSSLSPSFSPQRESVC